MKLYKKMENNVDTVNQKHYYHIHMNGHVFHVITTYSNANTSSQKYNEKKIKIINRLKYAEGKIFCVCIDVYKIYEGDNYDEI